MKTIQHDLKSTNLSLNEQNWLRIVYSGNWCLHLVLCTAGGACQKCSTNQSAMYIKCF